jgi:hypothetical protein
MHMIRVRRTVRLSQKEAEGVAQRAMGALKRRTLKFDELERPSDRSWVEYRFDLQTKKQKHIDDYVCVFLSASAMEPRFKVTFTLWVTEPRKKRRTT